MPLFRYEIVDREGKPLRGVMDAATDADVRQRLTSQGYTVNAIVSAAPPQPTKSTQASRPAPGPQPSTARASRATAPTNEMMIFFRTMQSYLHSGMTAFQALSEMARTARHAGMRKICARMAERVQNGDHLADSMMEFPRAFPPHVVGTVAAGELGGFLPIIIGDLAFDYELTQRASNKWIRWLCTMGWWNAIGILIISPALPIMAPSLTEGIGALGKGFMLYLQWVIPHMLIPLAVVLAIYYALCALAREPSIRPIMHKMILKMPAYGKASRTRSLANFTRILWRLQNAGLSPIRAWDGASHASENVIIAASLQEQTARLQTGIKISDALSETGYFSIDDARILAVSEAGGQTVDALQRMAAYYEDAAVTYATGPRNLSIRVIIMANVIACAYFFYCMAYKMNMAVLDHLGLKL